MKWTMKERAARVGAAHVPPETMRSDFIPHKKVGEDEGGAVEEALLGEGDHGEDGQGGGVPLRRNLGEVHAEAVRVGGAEGHRAGVVHHRAPSEQQQPEQHGQRGGTSRSRGHLRRWWLHSRPYFG